MRRIFLVVCALCSLAAFAAREKAVVFVDKFIPNDGCKITDGQIQVLQDRIIGNVVSSRKYEVVDRENLAKVQKELKLVDEGRTEGAAPESNRMKAAGYCIFGKVLQYRSYKQDLDIQQRLVGVIELQLRIENIATSQILGAPTFRTEHRGTMLAGVATTQNMELEVMTTALDKAAKEVVVKLNEIAFPVYIDDADGKYVTGNVASEQVTAGEIWDVWKLGKKIMDRDTGEWTGRYREKFICKVKVAIPGAKATKFECLNAEDGKMVEELMDNDVQMLLRKAVPDEKQAEERSRTTRSSRLDGIR